MAKYTIEVKWDSIYEIEAKDRETAIEKAIEYFQECEPKVTILGGNTDDCDEVKTYSFHDEESGENFFVEALSEEEAIVDANRYFVSPICYGEIPWEEAEALGYDTY